METPSEHRSAFLFDVGIILLGDEVVSTEHFLNLLKSSGDLLFGVCSHKAETDESVVRCNSRRNNRIDEDAFFAQIVSDLERLVVVADIEGDNRSGSIADFASHVAESFECITGHFPKMLLVFGLGFHNLKCLKSGGSGCRSDAGSEDVGTRVVAKEVGDFFVCSDESSERSKRL